jgi:UPF0755 protein
LNENLKPNPFGAYFTGKIIAIAVTALALISFVIFSVFYFIYACLPVSTEYKSVIIEIQPGMNLKQVTQVLSKNNLVNSPRAFRFLTWLENKENHIQVGEFELSPSLASGEILQIITSGKTHLHSVTIPEGYRITEIAAVVSAKGLTTEEEFLLESEKKELIEDLNIPTESLEGYLFPETYHFGKFLGTKKIIKNMIDTFKQRVMTPEILDRAKEMDMTIHETITLASLIEKETGLQSERSLISSVFHNRLKRNMLLQTDPTVIYAMSNFDGNIRKKDLSIDSPYNTYKYPGLPPGPIASPGLESILAALHPVESKFLYFVSRQDGSHHFSNSLVEHNRAVHRYQIRKRSN